jgi:hypothetical protein
MRETDSTMLVGKSVVLITWKYPNEAEIRRKVYMDPDDYELLRKLIAGGLTQPDSPRRLPRCLTSNPSPWCRLSAM